MTKRAFLMSICEVYGTYNKAMGQLVADYLDRYDEAELQILFDFTTTEFSHVYGKVPDKAKFEELRKKYNDAHQFDPIGVGFKRGRKELPAPEEEDFIKCPALSWCLFELMIAEIRKLAVAKGGRRLDY